MGWQVTDYFTIYREEGWYGAHPNIVRTPSGDLLTLFHRSPETGFSHHSHPLFDIRACRSKDHGTSWGPPELVTNYPYGGVLDFGTHTLSNGLIFLHGSTVDLIPSNQSETSKHSWISQPGLGFHIGSIDGGITWSNPENFPLLPDAINGYPASHTGICRSGLLESTPGGHLFLPGKATENIDGREPFFGMMLSSCDYGNNWKYSGRIAQDDIAHFSEPAIYMTPKGRIIVLIRCHPHQPGKDNHLVQVYSDDGGKTWSNWESTTMRGSPGHLLRLSDNRILATVGTRWEGKMGCMARVLDPEAENLNLAKDIVVRADSSGPDCGYPWAVELKNGMVLIVYYYTYEDGTRGIEGSLLEER